MTETLQILVCRLCGATVNRTLCTQRCAHDLIAPQNRPQGSVEIQIFRYEETREYQP